ncbi:VWA-like domain-containing protein [Cytophagaceae bacterium YF14B1]|uniref:VWA-like domain-containing protein n=1 Tax=Xanthocytophaga flava TaxID=3048013 RepID=A0AAE3QZ40_9BACT|nr:VWA-like domain-containing protein [Xanthocytophaga flavus]MDJ1485815.1 VWA-like domain-containing protein [Xanthocytophaga flavus]
MQNILDEVARVGVEFILNEPYYAHFLSSLNKQIDNSFGTMAVGVNGDTYVLYVNPIFWTETLTSKELRLGLVKHEVLHLVFKHVTRLEKHHIPFLYNVAADLVVNQYITRSHLPQTGMFLDTFPDVDLAPFESVDYYYDKLKKVWDSKGCCNSKCELPSPKPGAGKSSGMGSSSTSGGGSNGGNGNASGNGTGNSEEPSDSSEDNTEKPTINTYNLLESIGKNWTEEMLRHKGWEALARLNPVEKSIYDMQLDNLIRISVERSGQKSIGKLPAHLQRYLELFMIRKVPQLNWRKALRIFSESSRKTYIKNTLKKPSKRYGTVPGIKVKRKQKVLLAIDTSGSIGNEELSTFFSEIYHIWRSGAEVRIVECDAAIGNIYEYRGIVPKTVTGGGGTSFEPPLLYANQEYLPDMMIYFTDGYGSVPKMHLRFPLLWIITKEGIEQSSDTFQQLPGRRVKLRE